MDPLSGGLPPASEGLFTTSLNHCLPVYFSPMADPMSVGTDAMHQLWDNLQAYAFPPFGMVQQVLSKVRWSSNLTLTLIAPFWPQRILFPDLLDLLVSIPVLLSQRHYLLKQPHLHHYHCSLLALHLAAWRLANLPSALVNYQAKWLTYRSSILKVANFLLYLLTLRSVHLSYSSIGGYRSMLSSTFCFVLPDLSSSPVLHDIRSFRIEVPSVPSCVPSWDLSAVRSWALFAPLLLNL